MDIRTYNTRTYAVINLTDISLIDFSQIGQTSAGTVRRNIAQTQFVIKWEKGHIPTFILDGSVVPVGTYDHVDILDLMATPEWTPAQPIEE
tara:strand:+ start:451 stop:723 length:273 start_codon:yes stop_codon:yes gene_type:complete